MNGKKILETDVNIFNCRGKGQDEIRKHIIKGKKGCIIEDRYPRKQRRKRHKSETTRE